MPSSSASSSSTSICDTDNRPTRRRRIVLFKTPNTSSTPTPTSTSTSTSTPTPTSASAGPSSAPQYQDDPYNASFAASGWDVGFVPVLEEVFTTEKLERILQTARNEGGGRGRGRGEHWDAMIITSKRGAEGWVRAVKSSQLRLQSQDSVKRDGNKKGKGKERVREDNQSEGTHHDVDADVDVDWSHCQLFSVGQTSLDYLATTQVDSDLPEELRLNVRDAIRAKSASELAPLLRSWHGSRLSRRVSGQDPLSSQQSQSRSLSRDGDEASKRGGGGGGVHLEAESDAHPVPSTDNDLAENDTRRRPYSQQSAYANVVPHSYPERREDPARCAGRYLLIRGDKSTGEIADTIRQLGGDLEEVVVYQTSARASLGADIDCLVRDVLGTDGVDERKEGDLTIWHATDGDSVAYPHTSLSEFLPHHQHPAQHRETLWLAFFSPSSAGWVLPHLQLDGLEVLLPQKEYQQPPQQQEQSVANEASERTEQQHHTAGRTLRVAAIGETTARYLREKGVRVDAVAEEPTALGLLRAIDT